MCSFWLNSDGHHLKALRMFLSNDFSYIQRKILRAMLCKDIETLDPPGRELSEHTLKGAADNLFAQTREDS